MLHPKEEEKSYQDLPKNWGKNPTASIEILQQMKLTKELKASK